MYISTIACCCVCLACFKLELKNADIAFNCIDYLFTQHDL